MSEKSMGQVLVVDDEKPIRDMICFALRQADFDCIQAEDAESAYEQVTQDRPDIILLDWMLPNASGVEFAKMLNSRELYEDIPIIMLTARTEEQDKLKGFSAGCDDYITKPFSARELVARIKAVIRRTNPNKTGAPIQLGKLSLDPSSHRVSHDGKEIAIGPTEYRMLKFFLEHPDRVYSRSQLLDYVWGETTYVEERTIDVHIRRLRKLLEPFKMEGIIQTVRGTGYRLSEKLS